VRKLALFLLALLVLAVGAVLAAPSFIDWNAWRDDVAARVQAATGRAVEIEGDLSVRILPRPALSVDGLRLANIDGGSTRHMARVGALRATVAWAPLVQGEVRVTSLRIIDPVILLERLADGRTNWTFATEDDPGSGGASGTAGGPVVLPMPGTAQPDERNAEAPAVGMTVALENVQIRNGRVALRDAVHNRETNLSVPTLNLSADSLRGPYRVSGDIATGTPTPVPVVFDALVGSLDDGTTATPLDLDLLLPDTGETATLSGSLTDPLGSPVLHGSLTLKGPDLAAAAANLSALLDASPGSEGTLPRRPFSLSAALSADPASLSLSDLRADLDGAQAQGNARVTWANDGANAALTLRVRTLNLDEWFARAPQTGSAPAFHWPSLPAVLTGRIETTADALTWHGYAVRQVAVKATLDDGSLTLEDASAALPGAATLSARGTVTVEGGQPAFRGHVIASAANLRETLAWLGLPLEGPPSDRLRGFALGMQVDGTPAQARFTDVDMTLDTTRVSGALVLRGGQRLGLGANLRLESLNLDAYLPAAPPSAPEEFPGLARWVPGPAVLGLLDTVDVNALIAADSVTVHDLPLRDVSLAGSLVGGRLTLDRFTVADLAETRVTASGGLSGLGESLAFHGLSVDLEIDNPARTARLLNLDPPAALRGLGPLTQTVRLDGPANAVDVTAALHGQDGSLDLNGTVTGLPDEQPGYDLSVDLRHPDAAALARQIAHPDAPPPLPGDAAPVPLALATRVSGEGGALTLAALDLRIGNNRLEGAATVGLTDPRPHLVVDLRTDHLGIPLPPDMPLPSWLDADLNLTAGTLALGNLPPLTDATAQARWQPEALTLDSLTADVAGGRVQATATVTSPAGQTEPTWSSRIDAQDMDMARLLGVDEASDPETDALGTATLSLDLDGTGRRAEDLLSRTRGEATVSLTGLRPIPPALEGSPLAALLKPLGELDRTTAGLSGSADPGVRTTDVTGRAHLDSGILTVDALSLEHPLYQGALKGTVDLVAGTIEADGALTIPEGPFRAVVGDSVPLRVFGPLTDPAVRASFRRLRIDPARLRGQIR